MARRRQAGERPGHMFYREHWQSLEGLDNERAGDLTKKILRYAFNGEEPVFEDYPELRLLWSFFSSSSERQQEKYEWKIRQSTASGQYATYKRRAAERGKTPLSFTDWCAAEGFDRDFYRGNDAAVNQIAKEAGLNNRYEIYCRKCEKTGKETLEFDDWLERVAPEVVDE